MSKRLWRAVRPGAWIAGALCAWIVGAAGRASVVERLDVEQLTGLADRVVVGQVLSSRSHFTDNDRVIFTDAVLEVESTLKGDRAQRLVVRTSGGVVGDIGQRVAGSARLWPGERVVLFLEQLGDAAPGLPLCRTIGLAQGAFHVVVAADGSQQVVRDLDALTARRATGDGFAALPPDPALRLDRLLARVRSVLGQPPTGRAP